jgi:hypothetical protein
MKEEAKYREGLVHQKVQIQEQKRWEGERENGGGEDKESKIPKERKSKGKIQEHTMHS